MRDTSRFGKVALVYYKGKVVEDGTFIEDCTDGDPRRIRVGYAEVPRGFERMLYEIPCPGKCTAVFAPEDAFGFHDKNGIQLRSRATIPGGYELKEGDHLFWTSPLTHAQLPARVIKANEDYVTVDYNHPLAGKALEYEIELVGFEEYEEAAE